MSSKIEENENEFEWTVTKQDDSLSAFLQCPNKQRITSSTFKINDLPFTLEAYPNGDSDGNINSVMLYCTLLSLKETYKEIMVNVRLFCRDTNTSFTSIAHFTSTRNSAGWTPDTLHLDELLECSATTDQLTFGCTLRVLQITNTENEVVFRCDPPSELKTVSTLKWHIDSQSMDQIKECRTGRCFESEIIDETWCLRLYPNGKGTSGGNVKLYLMLCTVPTVIGTENEIVVQYTMWCQETESGYNSRIALNAEYPTIGWPNKIMMSSQLETLESMTMNAEIEIIRKPDDEVSDEDDDSDYSSSSSFRAVKGLIDNDDVDGDPNDDIDGDLNDDVDGTLEMKEPIPPQNEMSEMKLNDGDDDKVDDTEPPEDPPDSVTDKAPKPVDLESDLKEEPQTESTAVHRHRSKSKWKRKKMTVEEFKTISLDDLVENGADRDHYELAKRICHFFDAQFGDTDTVCLVASKGMQPAISYWVKDGFVRKEKDLMGLHLLIYRACGHQAAKEPVVNREKFQKFVEGISIGNNHEAVDVIADKLDERFGAGMFTMLCVDIYVHLIPTSF